MNIGGFHIFAGFFFLIICGCITFIHVNLAYMLLVLITRSTYKVRYAIAQNKWIAGKGKSPDELYEKPTVPYLNKRVWVKSIYLILIFMTIIYAHQRYSWMGSDNRHYKAKEYWVAGQVVDAHSTVLQKIFHPENYIIRPYMLLQKRIYHTGKKYLPDNDGEHFVWYNNWFLYPYSQKYKRPYLVTSKKYSPKMVRLLDKYWRTLKGMSTLQFSDPQMREKALLTLPALMSYYSSYQGHYTGPLLMSGVRLRKEKKYMDRHLLMLSWADDLLKTWKENDLWEKIIIKHPATASIRQSIVMNLIQNLVLSLSYNGEFSCNHPLVERMYKEYQDVMSADPERNHFLYLAKKNLKQACWGYQVSLYDGRGSSGNYFLNHLCKKEMPKELRILVNQKYHHYYQFYSSQRVEDVFETELKQLSEKEKNNE